MKWLAEKFEEIMTAVTFAEAGVYHLCKTSKEDMTSDKSGALQKAL